MKSKILLFFLLTVLFSCKKEQKNTVADWQVISENVKFKEENKVLKLQSGKFNYEIPTDRLPFKKVILLNSSLLGYFLELDFQSKIIGISSPEYIYSERIHQLIKDGKIQNVGSEQKYDIEKIIALKPDAVFTNYISSFENTYDLLKKNSIEIIFLDEYLEQNPLDKSRYLLVFGKLLGKDKEAVASYKKIQTSYDSIKKITEKPMDKPTVLANEMYGNQWFLPGGKTQLANYIADAGANYILKDNDDTKAVPTSFEEVFTKAENATIWVNAGTHKTKSSLLSINPNYAKMKVFQDGKIYSLSGKEKGSS
ncbi:MAG: ABC transporter substrate-binding protein, partial [Cruoricaptor ignavus]|nr:ABC transporter substrate-binding protein [Cruoricaptor ignavus]